MPTNMTFTWHFSDSRCNTVRLIDRLIWHDVMAFERRSRGIVSLGSRHGTVATVSNRPTSRWSAYVEIERKKTMRSRKYRHTYQQLGRLSVVVAVVYVVGHSSEETTCCRRLRLFVYIGKTIAGAGAILLQLFEVVIFWHIISSVFIWLVLKDVRCTRKSQQIGTI